jgi:hypothetical protein
MLPSSSRLARPCTSDQAASGVAGLVPVPGSVVAPARSCSPALSRAASEVRVVGVQ